MNKRVSIVTLLVIPLLLHEADFPNILKAIEQSGSFKPMFPFQINLYRPRNITDVRTWKDLKDYSAAYANRDGTAKASMRPSVSMSLPTE